MTIRRKITILFTGVVIGLLFISIGVQLRITEKSIQKNIFQSAKALAEMSAHSIHHFLNDTLSHASVVAHALPPEVVNARDTSRAEEILRDLSLTYPVFNNGVFLLGNDGTSWATFPPHPETYGQSFAFREYFQTTMAKGHGIIGEPYVSARTGEPVLTFTEILRDASGKKIGLVGCSLQLNSENALGHIQAQKFGISGYLYVYNKSRLMILHPNKDRILQHDVPTGANKLFDAGINGFEGVGETINSKNIPMLMAVVPVAGTDWLVAVQQPKTEAYAPLNHARTSALVFLGLGALFAGVAGTLSIGRFLSPLSILKEAVRRLEKTSSGLPESCSYSEQQHRTELENVSRAKDEIGELARAFTSLDAKLTENIQFLSRAAHEWQDSFDAVDVALFVVNTQRQALRLNRTAATLLDLDYKDTIGVPLGTLLFGERARCEAVCLEEVLEKPGGLVKTGSMTIQGDFEISGTRIKHGGDRDIGAVYVVRDVTRRNQFELHLRHSHKTEALGTMAGGIAHDFNNILTVILGCAELLKLPRADTQKRTKHIDEIIKTVEKGTELVKSLLSYCRKEAPETTMVEINDLLGDVQGIAKRLVGTHIELRLELGAGPFYFKGNKGQIVQVIMNLVANARDAMPDGGYVTIETTEIDMSLMPDRTAGKSLGIKVSDTGIGMLPESTDKIFDPFFTTKPEGSGTGLGLSIVHGIVNAHGGIISVDSQPSRGTSFTILLPLIKLEENLGCHEEDLAPVAL
jgi:signal transduction histidine kinase